MECSNVITGWHDASPSRAKFISVSMNVHGDTAPGREIEGIQEKLNPVAFSLCNDPCSQARLLEKTFLLE